MSFPSLSIKIFNSILRRFFALKEIPANRIENVKKILIVCSHFNPGELIASTSLFRAIKEKFPESDLVVLVSDDLSTGIKNHLIDEYVVIKIYRLFNPFYLYNRLQKIRTGFDLTLVPNIAKQSFLSDYMARFSDGKIKVGTKSLNGEINESGFCFDIKIDLNYSKHPDSNISERVLEIIRPLGFDTADLNTKIIINDRDYVSAKGRLSKIKADPSTTLVGMNIYSEEITKNWDLNNFVSLMQGIKKEFNCAIFLFGDDQNESVKFLKSKTAVPFLLIDNASIPEKAAIISLSDIFITVDSVLMHIAGTTSTAQISLFGNSNPFNFAPCGKNKIFLRKSDLIDEISADDVLDVCKVLLNNGSK